MTEIGDQLNERENRIGKISSLKFFSIFFQKLN